MQLTHEFTVPASLTETWTALNDIEGVAGCFPGATVTGAEGDSFEGTCKVKLGPIALVYKGAGAFVEKDEEAHRLKIEAKGKDRRGNGTAGADVLATMEDAGDGGTKVTVLTELAITGKPAQFGRGVMQDVSDKLLAQFVDCLADKLSAPGETATSSATAGAAAAADTATGSDQDAGPASQPTGAAAVEAPADDPDSGPASAPPGGGAAAGPTGGATAAPTPGPAPRTSTAPGSGPGPEDDALDLGAAVLPVLLKSYGKQAAAALVGLLALLWVVRRIRK